MKQVWKGSMVPLKRKDIPLLVGHTICLSGIGAGILALVIKLGLPSPLAIIQYLFSWFCFWFFPHCLTHFFVGKIHGIQFTNYFLGTTHLAKVAPPSIAALVRKFPVLGIRIEKTSLQRATPKGRYRMYASGALASMLLPFIVPLYLIANEQLAPTLFLLVVSVANAIATAILSPKVGDLYKARVSLGEQ